jgi:beta-N-acetylhexosaminidase
VLATSKSVIFGCAGLELRTEEAAFFASVKPVGFILFARNCQTPEQVQKLTRDLRQVIGNENALICIDQEGGRVSRLGLPYWRKVPSAKVFSDMVEQNPVAAYEALTLNVRLIGQELRELGINVNCLPVLDIPADGADPIIGDRALGKEPEQVSALGRLSCQALLHEGVLPIIKHIPGHGRASVDSHKTLPIVDTSRAELSEIDFKPFKALADMPIAMTAHVIYSSIDSERPATISTKIIQDVIRREICFDGLLMTDDLSMQALTGSFKDRTLSSLDAGCDVVLHCNGDMSEMVEVASVIPNLSTEGNKRLGRALEKIAKFETIDKLAALERLAKLGIN